MDLEVLVVEKVEELVEADKTFTAYDVTTELRADNPNESIFHYEVRPLVHKEMDELMANGVVYTVNRDFGKHPDGPFVYAPGQDSSITLPKIAMDKVYKTNQIYPGSRDRIYLSKAILEYLENPSKISLVEKVNKPVGLSIMNIDHYCTTNSQNEYELKTDCYGGVKIAKTRLEDAGIDISKPIFLHYTTFNGDPELIISNDKTEKP